MSKIFSAERTDWLIPSGEESDLFVSSTKPLEVKTGQNQQAYLTELDSTELFSKFTADIIKEEVIFTR